MKYLDGFPGNRKGYRKESNVNGTMIRVSRKIMFGNDEGFCYTRIILGEMC